MTGVTYEHLFVRAILFVPIVTLCVCGWGLLGLFATTEPLILGGFAIAGVITGGLCTSIVAREILSRGGSKLPKAVLYPD